MADFGTRSDTMAAEAAVEIVSQKLDILLSRPELVGCFPMETLVNDAKANLATIQKFFSSKDRPAKSTEWVVRLLQVLYHAEEFIDKFHLKVARGRHEVLLAATRPLTTLVHKYMLRRDMSNLVKAMKELCLDQYLPDKKEGGETKKEPASAPWEGQKLARLTNFWDPQASMNFVWHETHKEKIVERIRKEAESKVSSMNVHAISILGEKGAGKTFLARWVYNEAMYLGFGMRAWVHVSAINDPEEFLFEILIQVDKLARGMVHFNEVERTLRRELASENRFLIVLDDVRPSDVELLETLGMIINPLVSQGHIITTTQDPELASLMSSEPLELIHLDNLSEEESRTMLAMKLHGGTHDPSLSQMENEILKRFPSLPLCISLLSGLLSCDQERAALANDDSEISVSDLLELSYHRLPVHLKPCFIYMVLFPIASPIPTRRLVRLWLAEGLLDSHCCNRGTETTPEEVGETFILELADRNVIDVVSWRADGSPKACRMLTSLYDLICPVAISTGFLHIHKASKSRGREELNPTGQQQQLPAQMPQRAGIWWLAEHTNMVKDGRGDSLQDLNLGHVRSFLSFYHRRGVLTKDISTFLRKMNSETDYCLLRVLDLEGVCQPSLQGGLRKLVLLRYLGLRSTLLDSIPGEVADLRYLQTLDIKHTNITSLPSSLWKARNLRHLHLNWFYINLKILKAVMALTELQTLSGLVIGEVEEDSMTRYMNCFSFSSNMNSLTTLTKLKLFLQHSDNDTPGTAGKTVADWISFKLTNLQSLTFGAFQKAEPAEEAEEAKPAKEAMKKAERSEGAKPKMSLIGPLPELSLADQRHDLLELYLLGQLNGPSWKQLLPVSLRVLTLSGSRVEADMMTELGGLLGHLRTFRLLANSFLGPSLMFAKDGFPSLKFLKIWKLPQLEKMTIKQGAMPRLKELEFRRLDAMKNVEGINKCKELENICVVVRKGARGFVDRLKEEVRETTYMYKVKEISESRDDDKDNRDKKEEMLYLHIERDIKRPESEDDEHSVDNYDDALP